MFNNKTRNQHYISQVEQKLNSTDPSVDKKKRRIYKFESLNRELQEYKLCDESGVKIEQNLSFNDLYSLEIFDDGTRDNFEKYFCELESNIEQLTKEVLASKKLDKKTLLTLFNAKLMNVIRNPYCIVSTLNTYSEICRYKPVNRNLASYFEKINTLEVRESILLAFSISQAQFRQWLKIIFYMVVPIKISNGNYFNLAAEIIEKTFNTSKYYISIELATHENAICLLSDRAHVDLSKTLPGNCFRYGFNLTKNAFIYFTLIENNLVNLNKIGNIPENLISSMRERGINKLENPLKITKFENKDDIFRVYNLTVMYQCYKHFYAADQSFLK